jgi:hypothetical protein
LLQSNSKKEKRKKGHKKEKRKNSKNLFPGGYPLDPLTTINIELNEMLKKGVQRGNRLIKA